MLGLEKQTQIFTRCGFHRLENTQFPHIQDMGLFHYYSCDGTSMCWLTEGIFDYPEHEWNIKLDVNWSLTLNLSNYLSPLLSFSILSSCVSLGDICSEEKPTLRWYVTHLFQKHSKVVRNQLSNPQEELNCEFKLPFENIWGFLFIRPAGSTLCSFLDVSLFSSEHTFSLCSQQVLSIIYFL